MRSKEPVPDRNYGGDHPEQELPGQHPDSKQDLRSRPSLTIAEAARLCGVSASTIRRYLAGGRFPNAHPPHSPLHPPHTTQPPPPVSVDSGASRPTTCSQPVCGHARPEHLIQNGRTTARVAK